MEINTHDQIHGQIGGNMGDPDTAANDPIFWVHHCNVDRLWDVWLAKGHVNPTDSAWAKNIRNGVPSPWTLFDENGKAVQVTTEEFLIGGPKLDYQYDGLNGNLRPLLASFQLRDNIHQQNQVALSSPPGSGQLVQMTQSIMGNENRILVTAPGNRTVIGASPIHVQALIQEDKRPKLMQAVPLAATEAQSAPGVLLNIEGVKASGPPGVVFRVYLNEPAATSKTQTDEANFVGSIAIFQSSSPEHRQDGHNPASEGETFSYDISRLAQSLMERGKWEPDKVDVAKLVEGPGAMTSHGPK